MFFHFLVEIFHVDRAQFFSHFYWETVCRPENKSIRAFFKLFCAFDKCFRKSLFFLFENDNEMTAKYRKLMDFRCRVDRNITRLFYELLSQIRHNDNGNAQHDN